MADQEQQQKLIDELVTSLEAREKLAREQRSMPRFPLNMEIELCRHTDGNYVQVCTGWGMDASTGGVGIVSKTSLIAGDLLYARIHVRRLLDTFLPIRVIYCRRLIDDLYHIGCVFDFDAQGEEDDGMDEVERELAS